MSSGSPFGKICTRARPSGFTQARFRSGKAFATPFAPIGAQPSAYSATCLNIIGPAPPPISVGGRGCCTGFGYGSAGSNRTNSPSKPAGPSVHSDCIASTFSRVIARRFFQMTP